MDDIKTVEDILSLITSGKVDRITITKSFPIDGVKIHLLKNINGDRVCLEESSIAKETLDSQKDYGGWMFSQTVQRLYNNVEQYSKKAD